MTEGLYSLALGMHFPLSLTKQYHQLRTKCSNAGDYGEHANYHTLVPGVPKKIRVTGGLGTRLISSIFPQVPPNAI